MRFLPQLLYLLGVAGTGLGSAVDTRALREIVEAPGNAFDVGLKKRLSYGATITHSLASAPRWSAYHAPHPGTIVNVATEADVQVTVQYCLTRDVPFFAQNGGHGWIDRFFLGQNGVLINLRGLNSTTFNAQRTRARVGGGAIISETIAQAYAHDAQILTGNCNCVGTLGAGLGGGYGNLMGLYGFSVDNFVSMNVVLADGSAVVVTEDQPDLWWALRGAGPNFGIVTSALMKSYPMPKARNKAWLGGLFYTEDKIERVVQAIDDLKLKARMNVFFYYVTSGPPDFEPTVLVTPFFFGSKAEGRAAFKSLLDIGPYRDTTAVVPYNQWNAGGDGFCVKGDRKPSYGAGFGRMVPGTWRKIWDAYVAFLKIPGTGFSAILVECYSLGRAQAIPTSSAAFANREVRFNGVAIPWYSDAALDPKAEQFGSYVRDQWRSTDGLVTNRTYVNFAFGDESNEVVYDKSTPRLRKVKKQYDPNNVFYHWFDIKV